MVDLIGKAFDLALRIAALPDSSLITRRLCTVRRRLVAAPAYLERRGRPSHPSDLAEHACLGYAYLPTPHLWRFTNAAGEEFIVRPAGPISANNGDALMPAVAAGLGLALQPDFVVWRELESGALEAVLSDWEMAPIALHLVSPPGGLRPARVQALIEFLVLRGRLARGPAARRRRSERAAADRRDGVHGEHDCRDTHREEALPGAGRVRPRARRTTPGAPPPSAPSSAPTEPSPGLREVERRDGVQAARAPRPHPIRRGRHFGSAKAPMAVARSAPRHL